MRKRVHEDNINTKEYFEKIYSDSDWRRDWDGADSRANLVIDHLEHYKKHLDVGCADGYFTGHYLLKYPDTEGYGIDLSEAIIEQAKNMYPEGHFQQSDVYELPFEDNSFDLVYAAEIIEHLIDPERAMREIHRVLKKGGCYVMTVPNEHAAEIREHLWKWDDKGVRLMIKSAFTKSNLKGFDIVEQYAFHNGHTMYVKCIKL